MTDEIKAVAYYRMSSDKQEASIADQRTAVEAFAAATRPRRTLGGAGAAPFIDRRERASTGLLERQNQRVSLHPKRFLSVP